MTKNEILDAQFIPNAKDALATAKASLKAAEATHTVSDTNYYQYLDNVNLRCDDEDLNYAVQGCMVNAQDFIRFLDHDKTIRDTVKVLTSYLKKLNTYRYSRQVI